MSLLQFVGIIIVLLLGINNAWEVCVLNGGDETQKCDTNKCRDSKGMLAKAIPKCADFGRLHPGDKEPDIADCEYKKPEKYMDGLKIKTRIVTKIGQERTCRPPLGCGSNTECNTPCKDATGRTMHLQKCCQIKIDLDAESNDDITECNGFNFNGIVLENKNPIKPTCSQITGSGDRDTITTCSYGEVARHPCRTENDCLASKGGPGCMECTAPGKDKCKESDPKCWCKRCINKGVPHPNGCKTHTQCIKKSCEFCKIDGRNCGRTDYACRCTGCPATSHQEINNINNDWYNLFIDYQYDAAIEAVREEKALRLLKREKRNIIKAKYQLYHQ